MKRGNLMVNLLYGAIYIGAVLRWGDLKNWKKYYSSILFFMVGDLLYQFLFFNHSMWVYVPIGNDVNWARHTHISLLIMLIKYPATIFMFLGNLPERRGKRFYYIVGWTGLYFVNESLDLKLGGIRYMNGWNLGWSTLFSFVMFNILALHYKYPLLAWMAAVLFTITLWKIFGLHGDFLK